MKFDPNMCPKCGEKANRILTSIEAITRLYEREDGSFEFDDSNVSWETLCPIVGHGTVTLICRNSHGFKAELIDDPGEPPDDEPTLADKREAFDQMAAEIVAEAEAATSDFEIDLPFKYGLFVPGGSADGYYVIDGASNVTIASIDIDGNMQEGEAEEYAEFMTRACNCHHELLELVLGAYDRLTENDMQPPNDKLSVWLKKAEAVFRKARGGDRQSPA
jgi:hypothetical protein